MGRIQQLSVSVVNKIAAGEVIERPASVVKELLENSVDALATRIEVDIVAGGSELIRVVDDGEGIHPDDLLLAVTPHATSKIRSADDLFSVQTLGFRGEALASIAEVSRFRIRSRTAGQVHGSEIRVELGEMSPPSEVGAPLGTQIEIRNLFENTPVRRKFLKSPSTEFGHISEQFSRVALANPRLHLVLRHNDRVVYELAPSERALERLELFFGSDLTDKLIEVESELGGIRMWGYVGHPELSRPTRKQQYLFLNGRWIQDRTLHHALSEAYRGLVMVGRQPVTFLFIDVPSDAVDVNVHPTKVEVRFRDSQPLFRQLLGMIRNKFLGMDLHGTLKAPAGGGSATPGSLQFGSPGVRAVDPAAQSAVANEFADWAREKLLAWTPSTSPTWDQAETPGTVAGTEVLPAEIERGRSSFPLPKVEPFKPFGDTAAQFPVEVAEIPAAVVVPAIAAERDPTTAADAPRAMQIHDCYLVVETDDGMTVIDQHALHERIMYEHLRERVLAGSVESQRLLVPLPVEVAAREAAAVLEQRELLGQLGLGIDEFGKDTLLVDRYPVMLARADLPQLVRDLAETLDGGGPAVTRRDLLDELLHMMSCKAAIKAGQRLSQDEIDSLLSQRHLIENAHHCPHGRPTSLTLSRAELDRQFGRLG